MDHLIRRSNGYWDVSDKKVLGFDFSYIWACTFLANGDFHAIDGVGQRSVLINTGEWEQISAAPPDLVSGSTDITCAAIDLDVHVCTCGEGGPNHARARHSIWFTNQRQWQQTSDLREGVGGLPDNPGNIACAALNGELHVCCNIGLQVFHAIRFRDGGWRKFQTVNVGESISTINSLSCGSTQDGKVHACMIVDANTKTARFLHSVYDRASDQWQDHFGDPIGHYELTWAACSGVGNELHVCLSSEQEFPEIALYHLVREGGGGWQGYNKQGYLERSPNAGYPYRTACASFGPELHVLTRTKK